MARPQTLTPEQIEKVVLDFEKWIEKEADPTIVGFTSSYPAIELESGKKFYINKEYIRDHNEFSQLRTRAIQKQEAYLQRGATRGDLNASISIFRLKQPQHGFTDKTQVENDSTMTINIKDATDEQLAKLAGLSD